MVCRGEQLRSDVRATPRSACSHAHAPTTASPPSLSPLQIPHYHLEKATEAGKPVMGPYYREPEPSPGWFPSHLLAPLMRSFSRDHFVENEGDIVFYQKDENLTLRA